jgi:GT2 family glycosyltransferase
MKVIIPYANNPTDFAVLLTQLQSQTVLPDHIFVADNSKDKSGYQIALRYQWKVPISVVIKPGNIYTSWNRGIEYCQDDVCILNDDILIPENFIAVMNMFADSGKADMYCPDNAGFPPTQRVRKHYKWNNQKVAISRVITKPEQTHIPDLRGWCFCLPKKTIKDVGLFDESYGIWYGDKDYEMRLFEKGKSIAFLFGLNVHHYGTSSYSKIDKKLFNRSNIDDQVRFENKFGITHQDLGWDQYAQ